MIRKFFSRLFLILTLIVSFSAVENLYAQTAAGPGGPFSDPGCDNCCPNCPGCPPQCVPIDGGLSLLIAAGIGVGIWRRKKECANRKLPSIS